MRSPREIIKTALGEGRNKLLEHEAFEIAKYYGISVPEVTFVRSSKEAYDVADSVGYPAVVKVVSPDIVHKSDVGGVKLNLKSREEVAKAVEEMEKTIPLRAPGARIIGYIVQRMMPPGLEVIVGSIRDGVFGPAVMFGLGGIFVEVLRDVTFRIAPISYEDALEMINEIKAYRILEGYRGQPPVDKKALADIIVKLGNMMLDLKEIESVDLNPVIAYPSGAVAVDVRILLKKPEPTQHQKQGVR